jgi:hypothetical protein
MSEGTLGMSVPSRQRGEALGLALHVSGLVGASQTVASNAVRAQGYNAVVGLILSDVAFTIEIQGASAIRKAGRQVPGEWTTLESIASAASGARQRVALDHEVRADYIRIRLVNGASNESFLQHGVRLIPIFSFKRVEVVSGDIDVTAAPIGTPTPTTGSQSLALAALSLTSTPAVAKKARWVSIAFSAVLPALQTVTITLDSASGAAFDVPLESVNILPAASVAAQGYFFEFPPEMLLAAGDQIRVELTNTGAPAVTASAVIMMETG